MKKIIPLFLICIFLFNTMGYYIAFKAVQFTVKKEIKSRIKSDLANNELTIITVNKTDLASVDWRDNGKEMFYENEMYDIVRSTEADTFITYYCINDAKEKLLFANLEEHTNIHISTNKPVKNSASKTLAKHVLKVYFTYEQFFEFKKFDDHSSIFPFQINYTPAFIEISSPPPEFV